MAGERRQRRQLEYDRQRYPMELHDSRGLSVDEWLPVPRTLQQLDVEQHTDGERRAHRAVRSHVLAPARRNGHHHVGIGCYLHVARARQSSCTIEHPMASQYRRRGELVSGRRSHVGQLQHRDHSLNGSVAVPSRLHERGRLYGLEEQPLDRLVRPDCRAAAEFYRGLHRAAIHGDRQRHRQSTSQRAVVHEPRRGNHVEHDPGRQFQHLRRSRRREPRGRLVSRTL